MSGGVPRPEAFLLAGGQSSRMGRNKALIELDGQPLLARVAAAAAPVASTVRIIANDPESYARFGLELLPDRWPGAAALGGIATAVHACRGERALVLACDLPFLTPALLAWLVALDPGADVTLFETAEEGLHPLTALYSRRCLPAMEQRIRAGRLKVVDFFSEVRVRIAPETELCAAGFSPALLANLNTPQELEAARAAGSRRAME